MVRAGDTVYAPPGEEHFHGAAPDTFLMHTSVSLGRTERLEEVGGSEYAAAWEEVRQAAN